MTTSSRADQPRPQFTPLLHPISIPSLPTSPSGLRTGRRPPLGKSRGAPLPGPQKMSTEDRLAAIRTAQKLLSDILRRSDKIGNRCTYCRRMAGYAVRLIAVCQPRTHQTELLCPNMILCCAEHIDTRLSNSLTGEPIRSQVLNKRTAERKKMGRSRALGITGPVSSAGLPGLGRR